MPKSAPKPARLTSEQMLGDVRRELAKWQKRLLEREATGRDAQDLLFDLRAAAWPKHK